MDPLNSRCRLLPLRFALLLVLLSLVSCHRSGPAGSGEIMYVSAPEASLRDHVAAIYNRVGTVKNGDRVRVLERDRRFVRVRTAQKEEGWIELRSLVPSQTYEQFQQLSKDNRATPVEGLGVTRTELNMHVSPGRDTDTLYQLPEGGKVELLKRATCERATREEVAAHRAAELARAAGEPMRPEPKKKAANLRPAAPTPAEPPVPAAAEKAGLKALQPAASPTNQAAAAPANQPGQSDETMPMDDWWLARDQQGHTGWVLARMVDIDVPLDVLQYAEGQRIQAAFVLDTVQDEEKGTVPQYLMLLNENRNGIPYDFNQVRVFTWNLKKHRYETAYREHYIMGYFPATVSTENFGREGTMPVFTLREQNEDGSISQRKYRLIGNIVRQVLAPGEVPQRAAHSPDEPKRMLVESKKAGHRRHVPYRRKKD